MTKVWVKLDTAQLDKKMSRIDKELNSCAEDTAWDLAEKGKWKAKQLAPHYTGKTSDFIISRKSPIKGETKIIARNPTADRPDGFNLVYWMHTAPEARNHIHSGEPQFMYRTKDWLNGIKRKVAMGIYNRINIR